MREVDGGMVVEVEVEAVEMMLAADDFEVWRRGLCAEGSRGIDVEVVEVEVLVGWGMNRLRRPI